MAGPAVDRVRCRVGYASTTSVKISVVTFNNDSMVTCTCSGGSVAVGTRTAQGSGSVHCYTGIITITGLTAGTEYTFTISHGTDSISGSFQTLPESGDFKVMLGSCTKHNPKNTGQVWGAVKQYIQNNSPIAYAHIDDLLYADTLRVSNFTQIASTDPDTSLSQSGVPQDTKSEDDYIVAWMAWYGMFPNWWRLPGGDDFEWQFRNIAHWDQFGDHEFYSDANAHVETSSPAEAGSQPTIDAFAYDLWEAFIGDAGPPRLRAGEYYWGFRVGNVAFASPDFISKAQAYNACNVGDTGPRGATDSDWHIADVSVAANWEAVYSTGQPSFPTNPSRTDLGHATDDSPPDYIGSQQSSDLVTFFTSTESDADAKVLLSSKAITAHNQPWYDWHPDEFVSYISSIYGDNSCNGTDGHYFHFCGDVHAFAVDKFTANGSDGLGLTNLNGDVLFEFLCGTINSSSVGGLNRAMCQGGSRIATAYQEYTVSADYPQVDYASLCEMVFTDTDVQVSYIRLPSLQRWFGPYSLTFGSGDNEFTISREQKSFA